MRRLIIITLVFILCSLLGIIIWLAWQFFHTPLTIIGQNRDITISPHTTVNELAVDLYEQGILSHFHIFVLLAKLQGSLTHIKAGEYQLQVGMTASDLLKKLKKGDVVMRKITFLEGWNFQQVLAALKANQYLLHTINDHSPEVIMDLLGHPGEYPEGLFYPDTYLFSQGAKDSKILQMAYDVMQKKLKQAWQSRATQLPYQNPYQALIVASMIEKEAVLNKERPLIAGVIISRLQKQMPLQIDATVMYGAGGNYAKLLTKTDLQIDTPYNTYTRKGLPPTPIAMPRFASIEAALHPVQGRALYYVAKGDGSHIFSENLSAHHKATNKYWRPIAKELKAKRAFKTALMMLQTESLCVSPSLMRSFWTNGVFSNP